MPICLYAYIQTCLYPYMPTCLYAYLPTCLYGYRHISRLDRHHNSEQLIGLQRICVLCASGVRWHSKLVFSLVGGGYGTGIEMSICLYAYMPICIYAYMQTCLFAYMPTCLYGYRPICRLDRHHNSEQLIGFQRICVLCVSGVRWHSTIVFSQGGL